jgi:prepilin-type N-terminal cleavage/methylation domain-containing protein
VRQRGFTLVEVLIVAAIVITMAALVIASGQSARPFGMRSAADQFDAAIAYARSIAAGSGNGATIVFTLRKDGQGVAVPGFSARLYSGRPNALGPIVPVPMPAMNSSGDISEATLGKPPFSVFFNSAGDASAITGAVAAASALAAEPGCPGGGSEMTFTLSDPRSAVIRRLSCTQAIAGAAAAPFPLGP